MSDLYQIFMKLNLSDKDHNLDLDLVVDLGHDLDNDLDLDLDPSLTRGQPILSKLFSFSEAPACLIFTKFSGNLI